MTRREHNLVEIIRDCRVVVSEASELTKDGHYYLYRYNGMEGSFHRATVASGTADLHFRTLGDSDKIPLGGWNVIARSKPSKSHLQLVKAQEQRSLPCGTTDPKGDTRSDGTP